MTGIIETVCFFAVILAVYYLVPEKFRWMLLLAGSAAFYAFADWRMLFLFGGSIVLSYWAGLKMEGAATEKEKKGWMAGVIILLVFILFTFKYFNFFIETINDLLGIVGLGSAGFALQLVIPLGISYYTFKIISYLADIYQGKLEAEKHLGYYALYISFFPQILCGPIERAKDFLPQCHRGFRFQETLFSDGMERMIIGLFKKLVIADRLAGYVGTIFDMPMKYPALASILAACFYSIQIYCDFSGYSDMAIGMGQMLGIKTRENFDYPYFSKNIKEFWKRWHISLSSWLRDYIYIPLGGNRKGKLRQKINLMLTFLISGLWHGSSWNFVVWGVLHGIWNCISTPRKDELPIWRKVWQTLVTFSGVTVSWVFFRSIGPKAALRMIRHAVFDLQFSKAQIMEAITPLTGNDTCVAFFVLNILLIAFLGIFEWRKGKGKGNSMVWMALMFAGIILFGQFGNSSFLYGQF